MTKPEEAPTQAALSFASRNPDVLSCIANLSNDEVFTPPELANQMLDLVEQAWADSHSGASIWADSAVTFLDPFTKSGVFLREITKRLVDGLAETIPDLTERVDHILTKQVYGIGITELTALLARRSLYCSKWADGEHSIATSFNNPDGNIWFQRTEHSWVGGRCKYCNTSEVAYLRDDDLETYAYSFIHSDDVRTWISQIFGEKMKFDVVIGNPPYQMGAAPGIGDEDERVGRLRDVPVYHRFVEQAKLLEPRYVCMVTPSRWMAGGLGLSAFRATMLADTRLRVLVDHPVANEVFPGVEIKGGVSFFLWDSQYEGDTRVTLVRGTDRITQKRRLSEFDVFVRHPSAVDILHKVRCHGEEPVTSILSADKEFGWTSNFSDFHTKPGQNDVPLFYNRQGTRHLGYVSRDAIKKSLDLVDTWKVMIPSAGSGGGMVPDIVTGRPFVASSPSVCTQTYLFFYTDSAAKAESIQSYLTTRFLRFLVSLRKITQHASPATYSWVPLQSWDRIWTDNELYEKYGITEAEQEFIESMIRPMELPEEAAK